MTKLYVASSWEHPQQPALVEKLRDGDLRSITSEKLPRTGTRAFWINSK